jgi:hypothetical protein
VLALPSATSKLSKLIGTSSRRLLLKPPNASSSFSFRSSASSSSTALGLPVEEAFYNNEDISGLLKKRSETGVSHTLRRYVFKVMLYWGVVFEKNNT